MSKEKMESRRSFFKKFGMALVTATAVPFVSGICSGKDSVPDNPEPSEIPIDDDGPVLTSCHGCSGTCRYTCNYTCRTTCKNFCTGGCKQGCAAGCGGDCSNGCGGRCQNGCGGNCAGSCLISCSGSCDTGCGSSCYGTSV